MGLFVSAKLLHVRISKILYYKIILSGFSAFNIPVVQRLFIRDISRLAVNRVPFLSYFFWASTTAWMQKVGRRRTQSRKKSNSPAGETHS